MAAFLDNVRFNPTAGGTTDWTYSSIVASYQDPVSAGAISGATYEAFAVDTSNNWELSRGVCTIAAGVPTFARTAILYNSLGTGLAPGQSGAGAKINFASAPTVAIVPLSNDLAPLALALHSGNGGL